MPPATADAGKLTPINFDENFLRVWRASIIEEIRAKQQQVKAIDRLLSSRVDSGRNRDTLTQTE